MSSKSLVAGSGLFLLLQALTCDERVISSHPTVNGLKLNMKMDVAHAPYPSIIDSSMPKLEAVLHKPGGSVSALAALDVKVMGDEDEELQEIDSVFDTHYADPKVDMSLESLIRPPLRRGTPEMPLSDSSDSGETRPSSPDSGETPPSSPGKEDVTVIKAGGQRNVERRGAVPTLGLVRQMTRDLTTLATNSGIQSRWSKVRGIVTALKLFEQPDKIIHEHAAADTKDIQTEKEEDDGVPDLIDMRTALKTGSWWRPLSPSEMKKGELIQKGCNKTFVKSLLGINGLYAAGFELFWRVMGIDQKISSGFLDLTQLNTSERSNTANLTVWYKEGETKIGDKITTQYSGHDYIGKLKLNPTDVETSWDAWESINVTTIKTTRNALFPDDESKKAAKKKLGIKLTDDVMVIRMERELIYNDELNKTVLRQKISYGEHSIEHYFMAYKKPSKRTSA